MSINNDYEKILNFCNTLELSTLKEVSKSTLDWLFPFSQFALTKKIKLDVNIPIVNKYLHTLPCKLNDWINIQNIDEFTFVYNNKTSETNKYNFRNTLDIKDEILIFKYKIIILGEEYWFEKPNTIFIESKYLLNYLLNSSKISKLYDYIIIKNPGELLDTINRFGISNIKGIFLFQDVLSDAYLNNMNIINMYNYLENSNTYIYPAVNIINIFASKQYYQTLINELPFAALPKSQVVYLENYQPKDEKRIHTYLWRAVQNLWRYFEKVVIKKGYSYEGKQVIIVNRNKIKDFNHFSNIVFKLNKKTFWGIETDARELEKNITRYYIVQGFNSIIRNRENEFRVFFYNGIPKYMAKGSNIPNICIEDMEKFEIQSSSAIDTTTFDPKSVEYETLKSFILSDNFDSLKEYIDNPNLTLLNTGLKIAVLENKLEFVKIFIWRGASNISDVSSYTNSLDIIELLISKANKQDIQYLLNYYKENPSIIQTIQNIVNNKLALQNNVITFAKKVYKKYIPIIWKQKLPPILFRIDISYAIEPEFQDKYSIQLEGFENPIRLYVNELEIDPTSFFYNKFDCTDIPTFSSEMMQIEIAKSVDKYISLI